MIYHIASAADWAQAQVAGVYTTSSRGVTLAQEGFIHACTVDQVAGVARRYYLDAADLVLLVIDESRVVPEIRYEPAGEELYPHIYGPLNVDAVVESRPFDPA